MAVINELVKRCVALWKYLGSADTWVLAHYQADDTFILRHGPGNKLEKGKNGQLEFPPNSNKWVKETTILQGFHFNDFILRVLHCKQQLLFYCI